MPPQEDIHEAERAELRRQMSNLATLQVQGAIDLDDYLRLRSDLKAREAKLTRPAEVPALAPQPMLDLAELVEQMDRGELAELLDVMDAHFVQEAGALRLARVTRLG